MQVYSSTRQLIEKTVAFSLGVVVIELLTGRKPVDKEIMPRGLVVWPADMAALCVLRDPDHRPTMKSVVEVLQKVLDYNAARLEAQPPISAT
ncbi:hypothetical protein PTKIN_Ptkin04bG0234500 [Pterospermum kingtungense]